MLPVAKLVNRQKRGFTLTELLITIGIIGVLAAIVIVAVNPAGQLRNADQAKRKHSIRQIMNAQYQHVIDKGFFAADKTIPEGESSAMPICRTRVKDGICINMDGLLFDYLPCMPLDGAEPNNLLTGYRAFQNAGRFTTKSYTGSVLRPSDCEVPIFPVAQWKLDETVSNGPIVDYTDNGYTGTGYNFVTPYGSVTDIAPKPPTTRSFRFDGSNDWIDTSYNGLQRLNNFTLSLWFKTSSAATQHFLWQGHVFSSHIGDPMYDSSYLVHVNGWGSTNADAHEMNFSLGWLGTPNRLSFFYGEEVKGFGDPEYGLDPIDISIPFTDLNTWHHAAVVMTNSSGSVATAKLYLDGDFMAEDTGTFVADRSKWEVPLRIGRPAQASRYMNGYIDDVRVYDKALTSNELKRIANGLP